MKKPRRKSIDSLLPGLLVLSLTLCLTGGCNRSTTNPDDDGESRLQQPASVNVVVVDDEPLAAALERQLKSRANLDVTIRRMSVDEMKSQDSRSLKTDIMIYPIEMLVWMIDNEMLISFPEKVLDSAEIGNNDLLQIQRTVIPKMGSRQYALSIGSPSPVLLYRQDVFTELKIQPPKTWAEYQTAVDKIHETFVEGDNELNFESATCEPLQHHWAAQTLLARSASYVSQFGSYSTMFNIDTMEPQIDQPPFVNALEELIASAEKSGVDWKTIDPAGAEQMILDGKCAMATSWPTRNRRSAIKKSDQQRQTSIAALPGSNRVFQFRTGQWKDRDGGMPVTVPLVAATGRLISVSRSSQQSSFAFQLIGLIASKEMSAKVSAESEQAAPFRTSQLPTLSSWISEDYASSAATGYEKVIRRIDDQNLYMQSLRIPGRNEYLDALSDAVREALDGKDAKEALQAAAAKWKSITEEHGIEEQKSAYEKCFGIYFGE